MANKLIMYIPNPDFPLYRLEFNVETFGHSTSWTNQNSIKKNNRSTQNLPFVDYNLMLKRLDTQLNEPNYQNWIKSPSIKLWGLINSPTSLQSLSTFSSNTLLWSNCLKMIINIFTRNGGKIIVVPKVFSSKTLGIYYILIRWFELAFSNYSTTVSDGRTDRHWSTLY